MRKTYQIQMGEKGWQEAKPVYLRNITQEEAIFIANTFSAAYKTEVRLADVTFLDYADLKDKPLGNGIYIRNF